MMPHKNNKGTSLVMVVALIFLLAMVAMALMANAFNVSRQSAYTEAYEKMYYQAEAALQIADAVFFTVLSDFIMQYDYTGSVSGSSLSSKNKLTAAINTQAAYALTIAREQSEIYADAEINISQISVNNVLTMPYSFRAGFDFPTEFISFFGRLGDAESLLPFGEDWATIPLGREYAILNPLPGSAIVSYSLTSVVDGRGAAVVGREITFYPEKEGDFVIGTFYLPHRDDWLDDKTAEATYFFNHKLLKNTATIIEFTP